MRDKQTGFEDPLAFREQMLRMGVARIEINYHGSGDSLSHFDAAYHFAEAPPASMTGEEMVAKAQEVSTDRRMWDSKFAYDVACAKRDIIDNLAHGSHALNAAHALRCQARGESGQPMDINWNDILYDIVQGAGATMMFDNDGSAGDIEWDLTTNICNISSGYYSEPSRGDEGSYDDVFDAASSRDALTAAGIEIPGEENANA